MNRFVAIIWDPANPDTDQHAARLRLKLLQHHPQWREQTNASGFSIATPEQARTIKSDDQRACIIGPIFDASSPASPPLTRVDPTLATSLKHTRDRTLANNYWGCFISISANEDGVSIFRDPSGAAPCFWIKVDNVTIVFAHAPDILPLSDVRLTVNWAHLRAFLVHPYFVTADTGLQEAREVLPGERLAIRHNGAITTDWLWSAVDYAANRQKLGFSDACDLMRATAEGCFQSWSKAYPRIAVRLSGGLDSSIVAGLLAQNLGSTTIDLIHIVGTNYEAFEATLAQESAQKNGLSLTLLELERPQAINAAIPTPLPLARPTLQYLTAHIDALLTQFARENNVDAFMSGHGGDNVFLQKGVTAHTFADLLAEQALGPHTLERLYDASTLRQSPVSVILRTSIDTLLHRYEPRNHHPFLDAYIKDPLCPFSSELLRDLQHNHTTHPWLDTLSHLAPGKKDHVSEVAAVFRYYPTCGHALYSNALFPLFSQPIVELALQTPSYILAQGGIDRALARAAFQDLLPPSVINRVRKGSVAHQQVGFVARHLDTFKDFILNGHLMRRGWLERRRSESLLAHQHLLKGSTIAFLYQIVATELWLQSWHGRAA